MEHGEVRVVALKPGVGDHAPERFADHESRRNANHQGFSAFGPGAMDLENGRDNVRKVMASGC